LGEDTDILLDVPLVLSREDSVLPIIVVDSESFFRLGPLVFSHSGFFQVKKT
jgi:hypothetical protein